MKQYLIILGLLWSMMLASCSQVVDCKPDAMPFKASPSGKWGMLQADGNVLFQEKFAAKPTMSYNGRFFVMNTHGKWEIYTTEKSPVKIGDEYDAIAPFYCDVTVAAKSGECISIIDRDGNVKAKLDNVNGHEVEFARAFHDGYSVVKTKDGFCLINSDGKIVIEPNYCGMFYLNEGKLIAIDSKFSETDLRDVDEWLILNTSGKELFKNNPKELKDIKLNYSHGKLMLKTDEGWGLMDDKGEYVVKPSSDNHKIVDWNDNYFIYTDGYLYGLKDMNDDVVIRPKYDNLEFAGKDKNLLIANEHPHITHIIIDLNDNKLTKSYYVIFPTCDGMHFLAEWKMDCYKLLDEKGNELKNVDIYSISASSADEVVMNVKKAAEITADNGGNDDLENAQIAKMSAAVDSIFKDGEWIPISGFDVRGWEANQAQFDGCNINKVGYVAWFNPDKIAFLNSNGECIQIQLKYDLANLTGKVNDLIYSNRNKNEDRKLFVGKTASFSVVDGSLLINGLGEFDGLYKMRGNTE